jgi:hypothetical protein
LFAFPPYFSPTHHIGHPVVGRVELTRSTRATSIPHCYPCLDKTLDFLSIARTTDTQPLIHQFFPPPRHQHHHQPPRPAFSSDSTSIPKSQRQSLVEHQRLRPTSSYSTLSLPRRPLCFLPSFVGSSPVSTSSTNPQWRPALLID